MTLLTVRNIRGRAANGKGAVAALSGQPHGFRQAGQCKCDCCNRPR